jgi:hypothetical protein
VAVPRYRELDYPKDGFSYRDVVVPDELPIAFVTQSVVTELGLTWHAVIRYDLASGTCATVITPAALSRTCGSQRSWINALVGVESKGRQLYCVLGKESDIDGGTTVRYELCALSLDNGDLEILTELRNGFL